MNMLRTPYPHVIFLHLIICGRGSQEESPDGPAQSRNSRCAPHRLGRSGPRSAAGHGGIHLSALRRAGPEERPARTCAVSFHGWFFTGLAGRSHPLPSLPPNFPTSSHRYISLIGVSPSPAAMPHGFMQSVIRLGDAALAAGIPIRAGTRRSGESKQANKRRRSEHCLSEKLLPSRLRFHILSILPYFPLTGMG